MKKFAQLLDKLYFSYRHKAKLSLLQDFFKTTSDPERGYALAIMAGTLEFPTFKRELIRELIDQRIDPFLFELSLDYVGDLSETIALLWPNHQESKLPNLAEIIMVFQKLSKTEMAPFLAKLLDQSNRVERWALLKIGTRNLRIGVSARFLKKALAIYGGIDILDLEQVWHNLKPPYLELFAWLEGKSSIPHTFDANFFHPVMLSHPLKEKDLILISPDDFYAEYKYDGIRVQLVCTSKSKALYSRTGDNISQSFPDVLQEVNEPVVLDGELVIQNKNHIGSFNDLQKRLNRKKPNKKILQEQPAAIILYDLLEEKTQDLRRFSLLERRKRLEAWFRNYHPSNMILSELLFFDSAESLLELKQRALSKQAIAIEGLMLKRKNSTYVAGRPFGPWFKWKREPRLIDAVLMYAQRGHGKRSSYYSDYTFGLWREDELVPIGKAYFGFTDEELYQLDKWVRYHTQNHFGPVREVEKALVFEIAFDAVNYSSRHKSGVALRFPRINRVRWDKPANEADKLENLIALMNQSLI
ncbi:cisplatin damage response ATP-dependent DNA ligase [Legionella sp.]|uniref:cisplatin damage response ATP-dependent DNA ligase n=1 Tax=Legionella sp. TaxID=459 RepID=UPI000CB618D5|nr:cisplatin damage response ATP-dependent DNA ligase [Legionella sp.]PJE06930.1 MAG: ATP-dependent DNA ligase [Legionella sp.]